MRPVSKLVHFSEIELTFEELVGADRRRRDLVLSRMPNGRGLLIGVYSGHHQFGDTPEPSQTADIFRQEVFVWVFRALTTGAGTEGI